MAEKVTLLIDGKRFEHWHELELTLSMATFATCAFKAPFEPEYQAFRETFKPFAFTPLEILVDDDLLFRGTMVGVHPSQDAARSEVEVTGYALPAVLDDCNAPGDTVPHEFKKVDLRTIAAALADPFGIGTKFEAGPGKVFTKAKLDEDKTIFAFLTELAQQRSLVFTNTPEGLLLCWQSVDVGNPVGVFVVGNEQPLTKISASFNPNDYFSQITGFGRSKRKGTGAQHTEKNPWLPDVLRPNTYKVPDTDPADVPEATRAQLGRMFANMASFTLDDVPGWRDPSGALWQPNTTIKLTAPRVMIYRRSELLVKSVTLKQTATSETASFELVLPGAFNGRVPEFLPWDSEITAGF
jgi:prophage tail gpP-like protein